MCKDCGDKGHLPKHLQKIADNPKAQSIYKDAQYKKGVSMFGKKEAIKKMMDKYKK